MRHPRNSNPHERFARAMGTQLQRHPYSPQRTVEQRRMDWMVHKIIREEKIDAIRIIYGRKLVGFIKGQRKGRRLAQKLARRKNRR